MKTITRFYSFGLGLFLTLHLLHAQTPSGSTAPDGFYSDQDIQKLLEALTQVEPVPFAKVPPPRFSSFGYWSMQNPSGPPLPGNPLQLDLWSLGEGFYVLDDRKVDYAAIEAEAAKLAALAAEASGHSHSAKMRMSSLATVYAYGNLVYLTNMVATNSGSMTAAFDIAGGTNNLPYDILMTTNLTTPISAWTWLGIGYTSNRYTFPSQPSDTAFYLLAKPSKTMVVAWGENYFSQCDAPMGLTNALMITGGGGYTVALLNNGTAVGWGGRVSEGSIPTNLTGIAMIASGIDHKVALLTNGTVLVWDGNPLFGQNSVPAGLTNVAVISAQYLHTLALRKDGTVISWGDPGLPALAANTPVSVTNFIAIAAGCNHNLAVKADGTVMAWGDNSSGQCNVPTNLNNVVDVAAGWAHSVALKRDGTIAVWGNNTLGELNVPAGLSNVVQIAAAGYPSYSSYTLALKKDGTVVMWGRYKATLPLNGLNNVIAIGAEYDSALAIRTGPPTPVVTLEPVDQFQVPSSNAIFTAKGQGLYGVTYQWQTNSVNLPGATNATLTLTNVQPAQQGSYHVVVTDNAGNGSTTSSNASLSLVVPPVILSQSPMPTNQLAAYMTNLTLSVVASAPGITNGFPLSYQWRFNGTNIAGANANSYTLLVDTPTLGNYSVIVTNAVGSTTNLVWTVTMTYVGSYIAPGTLAYHLSTNTAAHTNGISNIYLSEFPLANWTYASYYGTNLALLTNAVWSTNFWLKGVQGLSATSIGASNGLGGQGLVTMVSPRHYLMATHVGWGGLMAFLDTNNLIQWRTTMQRIDIGSDTSVGIIDADLPTSVGFLSLMPTNFIDYLPIGGAIVQGIGMNQDIRIIGQPMSFGSLGQVSWSVNGMAPFGLTTNWNTALRGGDSSAPERFLIANKLVLVADNGSSESGYNYAFQFNLINQTMHSLSTNNSVGSDFQLTTHSLTNWLTIH